MAALSLPYPDGSSGALYVSAATDRVVWRHWAYTTSNSDTDATWPGWCGSTAAVTSTTAVDAVWESWVTTTINGTVNVSDPGFYYPFALERDEPISAMEQPYLTLAPRRSLEDGIKRELRHLAHVDLDNAQRVRGELIEQYGEAAVLAAEADALTDDATRWVLAQLQGSSEQERALSWRDRANQRAAAMLEAELTEQQRRDLDELGRFFVEVGQRLYAIKQGRSINILEVDPSDRSRTLAKYCVHPRMFCPDEDTMLAQKLLLEADEQTFLEIAHKF